MLYSFHKMVIRKYGEVLRIIIYSFGWGILWMNPANTEPVISLSLETDNPNYDDRSGAEFFIYDSNSQLGIDFLAATYAVSTTYETPISLAAAENFNPELELPPPEITPPPISTEPVKQFAVLEHIHVDFQNDNDNVGQINQIIETTAQFRLGDGSLIRVKTGFNTFKKSDVESISNIPLQVTWEGKIGDVTLETSTGIDTFNRLPTAMNFNAKIETAISPAQVSPEGKLTSLVSISGNVEQGPYKFNAPTLENEITAWRFGPSLFWQIDENTSLFTLYRWGNYNDSNSEKQSFSRLERKLGQFSVAANLFTWNYTSDVEEQSGYFSPPDFLVYNAELGWEGNLFDGWRCRFAFTVGQQRLNANFDNANSYQTRCTAKLAPNAELDLGYTISRVRNGDTRDSNYDNNGFIGQRRLTF